MTIQFGILVEGPRLLRWQLHCLQRLLALTDVRAAALVIQGSGHRAQPGESAHAGGAQGSADEYVALPAEMAALPSAIPPGLDFILSFAPERSEDELLQSARWGVWRHEFGDWTHSRGGPAGFWEVYGGHPESAVLLGRETRDPSSIVVLRAGFVRTLAQSPARNRAQLLACAPHFAAQVCMDLRNGVTDCLTSAPLRSTVPARRAPTLMHRALCAIRILGRMAGEGYRALFSHTQWNVGIVEQPITAFLSPERRAPVRWMVSPQGSQFRADPFGVVRDGHLTILLEDFSYITNRGTISAMEPATGATVPVRIGPQPAVHLSYPYLIEVQDRLYCIPEAHEAREVVLYEVTRFPDRWARVAAFPIDTVIVDATLFQHENRWWIAGSEPGTKGASSELHLWFAPALEGPWEAHPANPVKIDVRSARPAGTPFHHNGLLYRPAQDCSKTYGGRVAINQVTVLSPTAFREVVISTVEPYDSGAYREGIHTLSCAGDVTLIDGKRTLFVPEEFRRNARHFLRQALRGVGL
ncbi:MAG TPA: hypothetical protein VGL55_08965 [Steroidobacteraceae bacterium]|jgi:hypothetical protein